MIRDQLGVVMRRIICVALMCFCMMTTAVSCSSSAETGDTTQDTEGVVSSTESTEPEVTDTTDTISGREWVLAGQAVYDGSVLTLGETSSMSCTDDVPNTYIIECDITPGRNTDSGIRINRTEKSSYYVISPNLNKKGLTFTRIDSNGNKSILDTYEYDLTEGEYYSIRAVVFNASIKIYIAKLGESFGEYPAIDLPFGKSRPNEVAFDCTKGEYKVKNIVLRDNDVKMTGNSYTNPIATGADPFVLCHEGVYYLYSTNSPMQGYKVSVSTDLKSWTDKGYCLTAEDVYGTPTSTQGFWAPEVYYYNDQFYMIYTVEGHLGVAVSDSPLGPFKSPKQSYINNDKQEIDGHLFFDDDGKVYIYFVRCGSDVGQGRGNEIFGAEFDMNTFTYKNEKCLVYPEKNTWEWIGDAGYVAEGPAVLKHEGRYYLTYSANGYTSQNYAIGLAISDTPLGDYAKYKDNPILKKDPYLNVYGPGHHSFTYSPDGKELFIVYHKHQSSTSVHSRLVCIDRCNFVLDKELGYDVLSVIGPTSTAQPLPSGAKK